MQTHHTDSTGSLLAGRYRLGRVLGRGGMAEVRSAYDELAGHTVAVKLFRSDLDQPEAAARREAEGRIAEELRHPGLVRVYETSFDGPQAFLVMELVLGSALDRLLEDGPLPQSQVADLGAQLAETLASVHAAGIVHRDIKPSNVLLSSAGRGTWHTKLTDFGISRKVDAAHLTSTGLLVGTARYLSPEQAAGEPIGFGSDVYSLGLVLLESLTGQKSYPGNILETTVARLTRPPEIPDVVGPFAGLLAEMTARLPADRPSMADVAVRLRTLAAEGATPFRVAQPAPVPPVAVAVPAASASPVPALRRLPVRRALAGSAASLALVASLIGVLGNDSTNSATASGDRAAGNIAKTQGNGASGIGEIPPAPQTGTGGQTLVSNPVDRTAQDRREVRDRTRVQRPDARDRTPEAAPRPKREQRDPKAAPKDRSPKAGPKDRNPKAKPKVKDRNPKAAPKDRGPKDRNPKAAPKDRESRSKKPDARGPRDPGPRNGPSKPSKQDRDKPGKPDRDKAGRPDRDKPGKGKDKR